MGKYTQVHTCMSSTAHNTSLVNGHFGQDTGFYNGIGGGGGGGGGAVVWRIMAFYW